MSTLTPAVARDLASKRSAILAEMIRATDDGKSSEEQRAEFMERYVNMIVQAAQGDLAPRDAFIDLIIPGIKHTGFALDFVLGSMAAVAMALASVVDKDSLPWCYEFMRDYVSRLMAEWQES